VPKAMGWSQAASIASPTRACREALRPVEPGGSRLPLVLARESPLKAIRLNNLGNVQGSLRSGRGRPLL